MNLLSRVASGVAIVLGVLLGAAAPAHPTLTEQERHEGLWYARALKFDELQAAGHTGKDVQIAVIDNGINLSVPELQGASITAISLCAADYERTEVYPADSDDLLQAHGTSVTSLLVGNGIAGDGGAGSRGIVPDADIFFYGLPKEQDGNSKFCYPTHSEAAAVMDGRGSISYAIVAAVMDGADVISISMIGDFELFPDEFNLALAYAAREGVPVVSGSPNPGDPFSLADSSVPYPLNGVVAVGALASDGNPLSIGPIDSKLLGEGPGKGSPNLGVAAPGGNLLMPASENGWGPVIRAGTSLATPFVAGAVALGLEATPEATAYQVLQSMIRTTGTGQRSNPEWSGHLYGYGILNPTEMLLLDPTQFPDENPVFVKDASDPRCNEAVSMETCAWATHPTTEDLDRIWAVWDSETPAELPEPEPKQEVGSMPMMLMFTGGALLLGLIATAVIVPIAVSRSRKRRVLAELKAQKMFLQ